MTVLAPAIGAFFVMKKKIYYSDKEIEFLKQFDIVKSVSHNSLRFTFKFRCKLYDAWMKDKSYRCIISSIVEAGIPEKLLSYNKINSIIVRFKKNPPKNGNKYQTTIYNTSKEDNDYLLSTGLFVKAKNGNGIAFSDEFKNIIYDAYPDQSIEETITKFGIDINAVGYQRVYQLEKSFLNGFIKNNCDCIYTKEDITLYSKNPYVKSITSKSFRFYSNFYLDAQSLINDYSIDDILKAFMIDPSIFSISKKNQLFYKIRQHKKYKMHSMTFSDELLQITHNRMRMLENKIKDDFKYLRQNISSYTRKDRLCLFTMIDHLPQDPFKVYSKKYYYTLLGVSKSAFYNILKSRDYILKRAEIMNIRLQKDIEAVKTVIDYKGFKKGIKEVYMMMEDVVSFKFGINKIRKLVNIAGMKCMIRSQNKASQANRELVKKNTKANLLKRRFRLYKPNNVILSDVTYLDYGMGKRAYGSAALDPVTGKLLCFNISENNDLGLVRTTLSLIKDSGYKENCIFHTDQGSLYLNTYIQNKIKAMGLRQSMSKRGNCHDNAPQESFFGHFKDECDLKKAESIEELQELVDRYVEYYNNDRHQWTRNRMTPIQYEKYLNNMDEVEFKAYLDNEEKKYKEMKERARLNAIERFKTLGV